MEGELSILWGWGVPVGQHWLGVVGELCVLKLLLPSRSASDLNITNYFPQ